MGRGPNEEEQAKLEEQLETFAIGEDEVKKRYTFADETIREFEKLGVTARPRPRMQKSHETIFPDVKAGSFYDGRLPITMKQLSLDEVSMLLTLTSNWYGYLAAQYSIVTAKRSEAKRKRDAVWSIVRNWYRKVGKANGVAFTDQKCSDFARQDTRFVEVEDIYERLNILHEALYMLVEHTKKELDVVSREVTIRQTKMEAEARQRGIANRSVGDPRRARIPVDERGAIHEDTPRKVVAKMGRVNIRRPAQ